ncbi:hypothetical protein ES708_10402 [subsurface metagenome]
MKKAEVINCASNSLSSNTSFTLALSVMIKVVAKPKIKKMDPITEMPRLNVDCFFSIMLLFG